MNWQPRLGYACLSTDCEPRKERLGVNVRYEGVCDRVLQIVQSLNEVIGVGLAGSQALGLADKYSDLDLQVFVTAIPALDRRREAYAGVEGTGMGPLDHSVAEQFGNPPTSARFVVDWLTVDGLKCDVLWLPMGELMGILARLPGEWDQRESAAVLAEVVQPLYDPRGAVAEFKRACPAYPESRARDKVAALLGHAHFFLCDWAVLGKCLFRQDVLAYALAERQMVETLVDALYAANQVWQNDRRRLREQVGRFCVLPDRFMERIESMLLRQGRHKTLAACHEELLSLFRDISAGASQAHPDWRLPSRWRAKDWENGR